MIPEQNRLSGIFHDEQTLTISDVWAIIVKGRNLILFCAAVGLVAGLLASVFAERQYRAAVQINVERDLGRFFDVGSDAGAVSFYDPAFLATQTRLMRSREVAERVVTRLNLLGSAELMPSRSGFFRWLTGAKRGGGDVVAAAAKIQKSLTATPIPNTNLVELAYVGRSPKTTADIANAAAEAYIDWSLESKFQVVGQASKFLSTQIEQLKSDVEQKEEELHNYGMQKDIVSTDPKTNVTLQKLEQLNRDYTPAFPDRAAKEAHYYELQGTSNEAIADASNDGAVASMKSDVSTLERSYNAKLQIYKPEWPEMKQLRAQIDEARRALSKTMRDAAMQVRAAAQRDFLTAQRREQALQAELTTQKQEAMQLNSNAVEYNNLKNEVETKRNLLENLQKREAETEVTARLRGQRVSNIRIVDRALIPGDPFSPSYPKNSGSGLLYGLIAGLALAAVRESLDRSLRTVEQVEEQLRLPALGVIPDLAVTSATKRWYGYGFRHGKKRKSSEPGDVKIDLLPHTNPRSVVAEAYRAARTALLLSQAGGVRSIVVTSCLPAEGKTTTVLNLAIVLAQLGKRVLLIDGDLHRPRLHDALHLSNRVGLVSILVDNVSPTLAIQPTQVPGVSVILSGPPSPNPSGLLASESMKTLLQFAQMNFDYVLLDSPPLDSVADAMLIGVQTDGVVMCVQGGATPRDRVRRARNRLLNGNVTILGVLVNKFFENSFGSYGKSYQYYKAAYGSDQSAAANERRAS